MNFKKCILSKQKLLKGICYKIIKKVRLLHSKKQIKKISTTIIFANKNHKKLNNLCLTAKIL